MKRILAWVLLMVMVLGMFAGCKPTEEPTPTTDTNPAPTAPTNPVIQGPGAQDAIDALASDYPNSGDKTPVDYTRYAKKRVGGIVFDVVWTVGFAEDVENPEELIKITISEDGETALIDVYENCEKDIPYTLTATITDESGATASFTWNYILPQVEDMVAIVEEAYALQPDEVMDREVMLRGKIISLDSVYSEEHNSITVTIAIEGIEDKPIKCYRLTSTADTYDYIKNLLVGNIITVSGLIKNYNGIIEFDTGCKLLAYELGEASAVPTDVGEILKAAYALGKDQTLPYPVTLTGIVTQIDSPYDPDYGNISVVIEVEGYEKYPILCYRMKGMEAEEVAVKDIITVSGIIKNYNGTIEFDTGCQMKKRVSGGGVAEKPSSDAQKILADAAKLSAGEKLPYIATLTGEIYSMDNAFDPEFGNVTVTIKVNGVKIQCYRLSGDGANMIRETDKITVTGIIENYNGKLEFGKGCKLVSWEKGPRNVNYGPVKEGVAYRLYMDQKGIDKTVYFNGKVSSNRLQSTTTGSKGADVYAERISGKGLRFYFMDGQTKNYIEIEEFTNDKGQQRGGIRVTTTPSCYWVYNSDYGIYIVNLPTAGKYLLGTYGTYETFSASWLGYIDGSVASSSAQYVAKFIEASEVKDEAPSTTVVQGTAVENPVPGTGYKFGFYQNQAEGKPFLAFAGKMAGYYMATSGVISEMTDVYLESANGGYYLYFKNGSTKTYIDIVQRKNDATKVDVVLQTSGTHTVYQLNTEYNYVYTTAVGSEWYLGTYGANTNISASKTSYISDKATIGVSQFCAWFSTVEEVEAPDVPTEPQPSEPANVLVEEGVAYKLYMVQSGIGKTLYFNGTVSENRMQTTTVGTQGADVYAELDGSKIRFYYMDGNTKNYIEIEEYTNNKGQQRGQVKVTTEPTCYWTYDEANGVYVVNLPTAGNYFLGTYNTFDTITASWVGYIDGTYSGSTQYIAKFIKASDVTDEPTNPTEPQPSEPVSGVHVEMVTAPEAGAAYKLYVEQNNVGKTLYFAGTTANTDYFLSTTEDPNAAVDVYLEAANGGYYLYFMDGSTKTYIDLYLNGTYQNIRLVNEPGVVYTYNTEYNTLTAPVEGTDCYIGAYKEYQTLSCSKLSFAATSFPAHLGVIVEGGEEPEPTKPTEPVVPGDGYNRINSEAGFTSGKYVMIVSTGYAPGAYDNKWLSAVQPVVSGNTVTDTAGAIWTLTVNGNSVTITDANGVTIKPMGGNKNGVLDGDYEWTWSFNNGTFSFAGTGDDTVVLASNSVTTGEYPGNHRFRGYKTSTVGADPNTYPSQFTLYKLGGVTGEDPQPSEPNYSATLVAKPEAGTAYKWGIDKGDGSILFFTGNTESAEKNYRLETSTDAANAVDVYLEAANGGYRLYFMKDGEKTYIRVYQRENSDPGYGKGSLELITSTPEEVFAYDEALKTLIYTFDSNNAYYVGTYGSYVTFSVSNTSFISGDKASNVDVSQFPGRFYLIEEGGENPEVTEPEATEPQPSEPAGSATLENGAQVVIYAPAYNKALSADKVNATSFYNKGVDITVKNGEVTGYGNAEIWTVIKNADGTYSFANGGQNIGLAEDYSSMNLGAIYDDWTLISLGNGLYNIKNVGRGNFIEWYDSKGNWSSYNSPSAATDGQFQLSFYVVGKGTVGGEPEVTEPEVTEPEVTEPAAGSSVTYNFIDYAAGEAYGENETHVLDSLMTVFTNQCHFTKQLRLYQDAKGDGTAVFASAKKIASVVINAGHKSSDLKVYGSVDGENWVEIATISVAETSTNVSTYSNYTVTIPADASYKYLKLDAVKAQIRVAYMTFNFAE